MKRTLKRQLWLFAILLVALASTSCVDVDDGRLPVYPVTGHLFVNGQPAHHAKLFCRPQDPALKLYPHGRVDADGSFHLSTYQLNDGAPAGDYLVTIVWSDPPPAGSAPDAPEGPDRLEGKYADMAGSTLQINIAEGPNELDAFEIKTD